MNIAYGQPEDALEWCYIDPVTNVAQGPVPIRDLEVLWETKGISSETFVWNQSMTSWKKIAELPDLQKRILDDTYVPLNPVSQPVQQAAPKEPSKKFSDMPETVGSLMGKKEDPQEELDSLEKKFEKMKQNFYQGPDGLWYVLDPITKQWKAQNEAPNLELFNEDILEDLLLGMGGEDGNEHKKGKKKAAGKTNIVDLDTMTDEQIKKMEKNKKKAKKQAEKKRQKWYNSKVHAHLYAKGLPEDITHEELKEFFSKAGVIRLDLQNGAEKIKIYKDEKGRGKGDALISYLRGESVDLALEMLHETEIKPGYKVTLERAHFEQKGDYVPRKSVSADDKVALIKMKTDQDRMLSWNEEATGEGLKIVVIKNMFRLEEVEAEEDFVENLRQDIVDECETKLGMVQRVTIFENNPEGVVQIKFKEDAAAEACIKLMNGRFFAGNELQCFYWDGKTDYRRRETMEEEEKRLDEFGKWIEESNAVDDGAK